MCVGGGGLGGLQGPPTLSSLHAERSQRPKAAMADFVTLLSCSGPVQQNLICKIQLKFKQSSSSLLGFIVSSSQFSIFLYIFLIRH